MGTPPSIFRHPVSDQRPYADHCRPLLCPMPPAFGRRSQIDRHRDRMYPILLLPHKMMPVRIDQLQPPLYIGDPDAARAGRSGRTGGKRRIGRGCLYRKIRAIDHPEQQLLVVHGELYLDPNLPELLRSPSLSGLATLLAERFGTEDAPPARPEARRAGHLRCNGTAGGCRVRLPSKASPWRSRRCCWRTPANSDLPGR